MLVERIFERTSTLINHPKVAMISLTGDIATGKKVLTAATPFADDRYSIAVGPTGRLTPRPQPEP